MFVWFQCYSLAVELNWIKLSVKLTFHTIMTFWTDLPMNRE